MKKNIAIMTIFVVVFFMYNVRSIAITTSLNSLNETINYIIQLAEMQKYENAKQLLKIAENDLIKLSKLEKINEDKLEIVLQTVEKAGDELNNEEIQHNLVINKLRAFQLALNSLKEEENPVWKSMEVPVLQQLSEIEVSLNSQEKDNYLLKIEKLLEQYDVLSPALQVYMDKNEWEKLDNRVKSFLEKRNFVFFENVEGKKELDLLRAEFEAIFEDIEKNDEEPSLWWIISITGIVIISSLAYVGWKKYEARI